VISAEESIIHHFADSNAWALEMAQQPWVESLYRRAFRNFESSYIVRSDGWAQRGGIDRKINLKSARSVFVEEKFRSKDYGDFLLERWSDKVRRKPGWIQQDLLADYFAYIFVPSRSMWLLPFLDLRRAWIQHGRSWLNKYKCKDGINPTFRTENLPVPIPVVIKSITDGFFFRMEDAADKDIVIQSRQIDIPDVGHIKINSSGATK